MSNSVQTPNPELRTQNSRICAVITEETVDGVRAAMRRADGVADIIEIRLDCLRDFNFTRPEGLRTFVEAKPLPLIITCRAVSEGGRQYVENGARLRLLVEGARGGADYCDIEAAHYSQAASMSPDLSRLIVSYHNFMETPSDLESIYERITRLPAAIHKIATRANSIIDSLTIFRLLERARSEGKAFIAVAMQEAGLVTRVLGPSFGSFLTYGSLGHGRESAPGQVTCEELRSLYRVHQITRDTKIVGIIGSPVSHSASPAMHNRAMAALGLDYVYLPLEVYDPLSFFARFVRNETKQMNWPLCGLSVTIPHKTAVASLVDEIDETARKAGAVNTVVISHGRATGCNTDVAGAMQPLERVCSLKGETVGVIGAGGAARAVLLGLEARGAQANVFARDVEKARGLVEEFGVSVLPVEALASSDASVIINSTPVGMRGHSEGESAVPRAALAGRRIAYDLIYNPIETRFLKEAREEGCFVINGLEMLVAQAALQFKMWTGRDAPIDLMREAALEKIAASDH